MRFAAVQFDITWEDKPANHAIIEGMLREAQPSIAPGMFVLLPELGDTGFSMNLDRIADEQSVEQSLDWGRRLAREMQIFLQVGFARRDSASRKGLNCAAIIGPNGSIIAEYQKIHPFSYGKEAQHYVGGEHIVVAECGDAKVSPAICYDLRFPELWRVATLSGAEVFAMGASWPAARQHHWRALTIARAIENQAFVVAVNRVGSDPHLHYVGGSLIVSPKGEVLAEANDQPALLQTNLDLTALRRWREEFPALNDVHRELLGDANVISARSQPQWVDNSAHRS